MLYVNINTILFDLDGTLIDSIKPILKCLKKTFDDIQIDYPGDIAIKALIGTNLENILSPFMNGEQKNEAAKIYKQNYINVQEKGGIPLFGDTIDILQYLKNKNYTLGIVTGKLKKFTTPLLKQHHIEHFFDVVIGVDDTQKSKPNPDPLYKALSLVDKTNTEAVYIGDALSDLETARNADMNFIAITTGTTTKKAYEKQGQKTIVPNLLNLKKFF